MCKNPVKHQRSTRMESRLLVFATIVGVRGTRVRSVLPVVEVAALVVGPVGNSNRITNRSSISRHTTKRVVVVGITMPRVDDVAFWAPPWARWAVYPYASFAFWVNHSLKKIYRD